MLVPLLKDADPETRMTAITRPDHPLFRRQSLETGDDRGAEER